LSVAVFALSAALVMLSFVTLPLFSVSAASASDVVQVETAEQTPFAQSVADGGLDEPQPEARTASATRTAASEGFVPPVSVLADVRSNRVGAIVAGR